MKRLALALSVAAVVVACKKDAQPQPPADTTAAVAAPMPADTVAARDTSKMATDTAKAAAQPH